MAEENQNESEEPNDDDAGKTSGVGGKGLMFAFIGLIVLVESAMVIFMIPSAEQVSALAEANLIKTIEESEEGANQMAIDENERQEFQLGMYGETFSPFGTEATYTIEVDLYGLVRRKDYEQMQTEFTEKEGRLRHAIRQRIRNSTLEELEENNHGVLQRRILTECNHLLDEDLLLAVGFKSYSPRKQ